MACWSVELSISNLIILGALVFGVKKLIKFFQKWKVDRMLARWDNTPRDKVMLHTIPRCKPLPSISPFGLKLETYLRMAKIPHEVDMKDCMGPKDKAPWISYNGTHVADSHLCIQFLNKKFSVDLNKNFTTEQLASARSCRVMLEEHFFWGIVQFRWMESSGALAQVMKIPAAFRFTLPVIAATIRKRMAVNGMGQHSRTEIYEMTEDDLRSASSILGNKKFFGGDEPCEDDCAVFGMTSQAVWGMPGSSFERLVHGELSNLKQYSERMKERYWPDWEACMDK